MSSGRYLVETSAFIARSTGLGVLTLPLDPSRRPSGGELLVRPDTDAAVPYVGPMNGLVVALLAPFPMLFARLSDPVGAFLRFGTTSGVALRRGLGLAFLLLAPRRPLPVAVLIPASTATIRGDMFWPCA